ncbi:sulfite exporter TauE/SafE family protein [Candidatus Chrysopegis kryptomonas]|nr:sulfite exporter TauE/SafE family protein [Candidatus Chrysopegis kryptomonas]
MMIYFVFFIIALIYSSVGLAGGSAYVAFLAILGTDRIYIPSTAQFLNIIVSFLGSLNYRKHFQKDFLKDVLIIYALSISGVVLGSKIELSDRAFYIILGLSLIASSVLSFLKDKISKIKFSIPRYFVPFFGFAFGFLTGIVGIGGGIFLSPILLLANFPVKLVAFITSLYILLNSSAGFLTNVYAGRVDISLSLSLAFFVALGGFVGSYFGSSKFKPEIVKATLNTIILFIGGQILWRGIT